MNDEFLITPPSKLVQKWWDDAVGTFTHLDDETYVAIQAATWGANEELKACCEYIGGAGKWFASPQYRLAELRCHRRPKPPSLKQQACDALDTYVYGNPDQDDKIRTYNIIRQALETLSND